MSKKPRVRTVFFDYDGCIHDSLKIYVPAFHQAKNFLRQAGHSVSGCVIEDNSDNTIKKWIGLSPEDMWIKFRPDLPIEVREKASEIIGSHMHDAILSGKAVLYPGAEKVLKQIRSAGIRMILLSHCKLKYIEAHRKLFGLDRYFERIIATELYDYMDKGKILALIKNQYPYPQIMIGDRKSDINAGQTNQIKTIGCNYGYAGESELDAADYRVDSIKEIIKILTE